MRRVLGLLGLSLGIFLSDLPIFGIRQEYGWAQTVSDHKAEIEKLNKQGLQQYRQGQFQKALENFQQALSISKQINDRFREGRSLNNIGLVYDSLGQYNKALEFYQQSLRIRKEVRDQSGEGTTLNNIGVVYEGVGQYLKALEFYQQALVVKKALNDRSGESIVLNNIGSTYKQLGQYAKALESYQQALVIVKEIKDGNAEGIILNGIGSIYENLGQYTKALNIYQQALEINKQVKNLAAESSTLTNIGSAYSNLEKYDQALNFYQKALVIAQKIGDRSSESTVLNNLGWTYRNLKKSDQALNAYQQALVISKEIGDVDGEGVTLGNIGITYRELKQYNKAIESYQQAIAINQKVGDRHSEANNLANMSIVLFLQSQPELAILFYKKSINIYEAIRKDIKNLTQESQQSFTSTVTYTYLNLADLLIEKGRIAEALQVLDLLKIQEIEDYLKNIKGNDITAQGLRLLDPEKAISNKLLAISLEQMTELNQQLASQLQQIPKSEINKVPPYFQNIPKGTALIYPFILDDRLELIIYIPNTLPINRTIPIKKEELQQLVNDFRSTLQDYGSEDIKTSGKKLYDLLIKPIEAELQQSNTMTILYAPDRFLRYIPLAALYDGKQYLVEKYRINNLIAYSLFDGNQKAISNFRIYAGAFGGKAGERKFGQNTLPASIPEVELITSIFPNSQKYIEQNFTDKTTKEKVAGNTIIHFATHALFNSDNPFESYVLFGDGSKITLAEISDLPLKNTELVVLSACQTGLGGTLGTGAEILGFGYQVQRAGAKASIASLWIVSDDGTKLLMQEFYKNVQKGNMATSAALRDAQLSMIRRPLKEREINYNHPYFWSAFVVIGNGL